MNNIQLYLSIGVPTFAVLLAWLSNRSDNSRTNDRLDRMNDKMDKLGDTLRTEISAQGNSLRTEMVAFRREVHQDLLMLHERVVKVETRQEL